MKKGSCSPSRPPDLTLLSHSWQCPHPACDSHLSASSRPKGRKWLLPGKVEAPHCAPEGWFCKPPGVRLLPTRMPYWAPEPPSRILARFGAACPGDWPRGPASRCGGGLSPCFQRRKGQLPSPRPAGVGRARGRPGGTVKCGGWVGWRAGQRCRHP